MRYDCEDEKTAYEGRQMRKGAAHIRLQRVGGFARVALIVVAVLAAVGFGIYQYLQAKFNPMLCKVDGCYNYHQEGSEFCYSHRDREASATTEEAKASETGSGERVRRTATEEAAASTERPRRTQTDTNLGSLYDPWDYDGPDDYADDKDDARDPNSWQDAYDEWEDEFGVEEE